MISVTLSRLKLNKNDTRYGLKRNRETPVVAMKSSLLMRKVSSLII